MTPRIELRAKVRAEPLPVGAVFARGAVAHALARRLVERMAAATDAGDERDRVDREPVEGISIVRAEHDGVPVLVAIGVPERLPWVDGAVWLGRAPEAPSVWLPTLCALEPHPALVASALTSDVSAPFVLVPEGARWIALSLARAHALDADLLAPLLVREAHP
ncbi:MAG: hypothetical protein MUE69_08430 [Myxococcota bacterium]|jgi:hypothetical protein|nr:hypothetical protein [Myxococcota bacterium]